MKKTLMALLLLAPLVGHATQDNLNKILKDRKACNDAAHSQVAYLGCEQSARDPLDFEMGMDIFALKQKAGLNTPELDAATGTWYVYRDKQIDYIQHTSSGGHGAGLAMAKANNDLMAAFIQLILDN